MSVSTAIGMVSESLRNLLNEELTLDPPVNVTILAPDEAAGNRRINLFLYKVQENSALKNMDWQVNRNAPTQLIPPPLSLNLFYLLTPYAPNDSQTGNSTAHEILGDAMRVFYENPVIPQEYLEEELIGAREQIKILHNSLDIEELSKVWSTFTQPFRLSVLYEVSVVQLDMQPESEQPMANRVRRIGVPDVRAPFKPPAVLRINPLSGPAGTVITFTGENLSGWNAYVRVMGTQVLNREEITDESFTMAIPAEISPEQPFPLGFHEIRVDISHLYRRTFFFEVTA